MEYTVFKQQANFLGCQSLNGSKFSFFFFFLTKLKMLKNPEGSQVAFLSTKNYIWEHISDVKLKRLDSC